MSYKTKEVDFKTKIKCGCHPEEILTDLRISMGDKYWIEMTDILELAS
jgi:hypothetical protein